MFKCPMCMRHTSLYFNGDNSPSNTAQITVYHCTNGLINHILSGTQKLLHSHHWRIYSEEYYHNDEDNSTTYRLKDSTTYSEEYHNNNVIM